MRSRVEIGPGDMRPQSLAVLGIVLALGAGMAMTFVHGAWFAAAAGFVGLGIVLALVGFWAAWKVSRGDVQPPRNSPGRWRQ